MRWNHFKTNHARKLYHPYTYLQKTVQSATQRSNFNNFTDKLEIIRIFHMPTQWYDPDAYADNHNIFTEILYITLT